MHKSYNEIAEFLQQKNFHAYIDKLAQKYKNKKIILYGAGLTFDVINDNYDLSKLNITAISDLKFNDNEQYNGYKTLSPEGIFKNKPDIVLITMFYSNTAQSFFETQLFPKFGKFKYSPLINFSFFDSLKIYSSPVEIKVSVITICYNNEADIEDTIKSVINQAYPNVEYIIIDGASCDDTLNIIKKYSDKVNKLISEPDSGIYNAMNKGIKSATGDFIIFMNAGDAFYSDDVLEKASVYLEKHHNCVFFGDPEFVDQRSKEWLYSHRDIDQPTLYNSLICHQCIFYKKTVFDEYGLYDEKYPIYADHDLNLKLLIKNKCRPRYLPFPVAKFKLGGVSTSKEYLAIRSEEKKSVLDKYFTSHDLNMFKILFAIEKTIFNYKLRKYFRKFFCFLFGYGIKKD